MPKLTVALITRNEESVIGHCLESLKWADEIVVLDGYSTDKTVEICRRYTDNIFQRPFESFPRERQYILDQASNDWVLSIDADMYFPPEICREIQSELETEPRVDGYYLAGLTVFLGKEIRHSSWFEKRYLRLFNRTKGSYDYNYEVLDVFQLKGRTKKLKNFFYHYAKEDFIEYFVKIKRYSYLTALEYRKKGVLITRLNSVWYLFSKPVLIFLHRYIWKRGFLDGSVGLIVGINAAISYYVAFATLWDIQRKEKAGNTTGSEHA